MIFDIIHGIKIGQAIAHVNHRRGILGIAAMVGENLANYRDFVFLIHQKIDAGGLLVLVIGKSGGENIVEKGSDGGLVEKNFDTGAQNDVFDCVILHFGKKSGNARIIFELVGAESKIFVGEGKTVLFQGVEINLPESAVSIKILVVGSFEHGMHKIRIGAAAFEAAFFQNGKFGPGVWSQSAIKIINYQWFLGHK